MNGLNTAGKVITKILEVFHWVGAALLIAATVCAAAAPDFLGYFVSFDAKECCGANLSVYGFDITAPVKSGRVDTASFIIFGIGATAILALMAMIFRNLSQIFKKSENATPFQKDNVRLIREVGIFSIIIPIVGFIMSVIARLVTGSEATEISVDMGGIAMGIIVLSFTQFFAHGVELENDVDGLL